jgi:hypothetical protein
MKPIKTYPTDIEADQARIALHGAGIPTVVVCTGIRMGRGDAGVQLLVPNDRVAAAQTLLDPA